MDLQVSREARAPRVVLPGWGVAGMLAQSLRGVPFWDWPCGGFEDEDPYSNRVPWLPDPGSGSFARAGVVCGLAGVPDGDSGCGWSGWSGALCALALAIIPLQQRIIP